jgi:hypothetical protein
MAHFAEVDADGKVLRVIVIGNEEEDRGQEYINDVLGIPGTWLQTSYNTVAGKHLKGGIPFRKNYAGIGYTYDAVRDAFIPPKPPEGQNSKHELDNDTCTWVDTLSAKQNPT